MCAQSPSSYVVPFVARMCWPLTEKRMSGHEFSNDSTAPEKLGSPCWLTVNARPATIAVPVLWAMLVFACTWNVTCPSPVPWLPDVNTIHGNAVSADQAQGDCVCTCTTPPPPVAPTEADVGSIV